MNFLGAAITVETVGTEITKGTVDRNAGNSFDHILIPGDRVMIVEG
jgi:hypothetical protein